MTYKLHSGRPKKIPEYYYEDKEISELKHKRKVPFTEYSRVGSRRAFHMSGRVHEKGKIVNYKGNFAIVREVRENGLILEPFKKDKDGFSLPSKKLIFIPEKKVSHQVYPAIENPKYMLADMIF